MNILLNSGAVFAGDTASCTILRDLYVLPSCVDLATWRYVGTVDLVSLVIAALYCCGGGLLSHVIACYHVLSLGSRRCPRIC
jgi:hypothetical protein